MTKEELIGRKFRAAPNGEGQINYLYEHPNPEHIYISTDPNLTRDQVYGFGKKMLIGDHKIGYIAGHFAKGIWKFVEEEPTYKVMTFKDVDPKTIKFDFKDTCIETANEEEYDWVIEVANANGLFMRSKTPYNKGTAEKLFFREANITYAYAGYKSSLRPCKEITIQDILNSNNMSEEIEVGDIVVLKSYPTEGKYEVVGFKNKDYAYVTIVGKPHNGIDWNPTNGLLLVSKGKKKEVVGYETVVDLPGIPKGTKSTKITQSGSFGTHDYKFEDDNSKTVVLYTTKQLQDTKFFKPIYKQDAIELVFSKHKATLSKEAGLVFSDRESLDYKSLGKLLIKLDSTVTNVGKFGKFEVLLDVEVKSIQVGCKTFTTKDLKLVTDAFKKLDE